MWWGTSSEEKEADERGTNETIPVTPRLLPSESIPSPLQPSVPVPVMVPDVSNLKEQFQQQQNMLTQIKETLKQNESQFSSKEKQAEAYANRLTQIKARSRNSQGKNSGSVSSVSTAKSLSRRSSKENLARDNETSDSGKSPNKSKVSAKGKMTELKKRLEENKIKFEKHTGKELSETKKIESIVEHLKTQLEERDVTIQELQKTIEQPTAKKGDTLPRKSTKSEKEPISTKSTQTIGHQGSDETVERIAMQNKIYQLETSVMDLEEALKEKELVIEARTQAVTLLTQDLSMKGKNTLDNLEDTRQEMRSMQNNFVVIENQLKEDLLEKDNRLSQTEEKFKKLESINFDLSLKNAELQEKLVNMQSINSELESDRKLLLESITKSQTDTGADELNNKIVILTKELDDSNKLMIKMKLEHKNKIKTLNKTLEKIKQSSDDKAEICRLLNRADELESIKQTLENKVAELEEEKAVEKKLKEQINGLEMRIKQQSDDLDSHVHVISSLESEKLDLLQSTQDQNIVIENLYAKIRELETVAERGAVLATRLEEMESKLQAAEAEHEEKTRVLKSEHEKEIQSLENYYSSKTEESERNELEEYRISNELNNIHVEEQIELLVREKQQLLEKLKNLSGVSSTDSLTFEKMEHSDLRDDDKETTPTPDSNLGTDPGSQSERIVGLEKLSNEQQLLITSLQQTIEVEKQKAVDYQIKVTELEKTIESLEKINSQYRTEVENSSSGGSAKSNTNAKNKLKKIESELAENKMIVKEQNEKIEELNAKLEEKEQLIRNYIEKIEEFEKDDWGRENDWKITRDELENVQELQKKCLSLENNLIELNEDCERLRKENIEVVHLLSEEKVKRKKLQEQLEAKSDSVQFEWKEPSLYGSVMEESVEVLTKSVELNDRTLEHQEEDSESFQQYVEEKVRRLYKLNQGLEEKVGRLEAMSANFDVDQGKIQSLEESNRELQEKLEWSNIVLTSKETEIFRLENLLQDHLRNMEGMEKDLKEARDRLAERNEKLDEIIAELGTKEKQLEEISINFDRLKESVDFANQKTATNETQLKELLETVREMEGDVSKKEDELLEIKGILAEKNLDMSNLRKRLEEVNSDLTYSYQEHLENMGKCLRDKEAEFDELLAEKARLEEAHRNSVVEIEDLFNQKIEVLKRNDDLERLLEEKEKAMNELQSSISAKVATTELEAKVSSKEHEMEELKTKMKKLAANLKKKAQNEKDLMQQVKQYEEFISEKDRILQKLQADAAEVTEKWASEKSEKEQYQSQLSAIFAQKTDAENRAAQLEKLNADLNAEFKRVETEFNNECQRNEYKVQQMETQLQKMYENSERSRILQEQDKKTIADLEQRFFDVTEMYEKLSDLSKTKLLEIDEEKRISQELNQKLTEIVEKYKSTQSDHKKLQVEHEQLASERSGLSAKLLEMSAVIESLEAELAEKQEHLRRAGEKLSGLEEGYAQVEALTARLSDEEQTRDQLEHRINELLTSQRVLEETIQVLKDENADLREIHEQIEKDRSDLEKEVNGLNDKFARSREEFEKLKALNSDKEIAIQSLTEESDRVNSLNERKKSEMERLTRELQAVQEELKLSWENAEAIQQSQQRRLDELTREKALLVEKLEEKIHHEEKPKEEDEKKPKKRKSVTFRTDELEYIKELKNQIHNYDATLKLANEETERLKMELFREKLRHEVTDVVTEAQTKVESLKSSPETEKKFDASVFFTSESQPGFETAFGPQENLNVDYDSLVWDDGWGADGQLEEQYLNLKQETEPPKEDERLKLLEKELKETEVEKENILEELRVSQAKYARVIKKLKEQKSLTDKLQAEANKSKSGDFGDLDAAIIDELKSQIGKLEAREKELLKDLDNSKVEKENLLKRMDVLNLGNEKFLEMKERQDNQVELWESKNKELLREMMELRNQLDNPDDDVRKENKELRNQVEGLEWRISELKEILEDEEEVKKKLLEEEVRNAELENQISALAAENESLQGILGEMKESKPVEKVPKSPEGESSRIFDYFRAAPASDLFPAVMEPANALEEQLKEKADQMDALMKEKEIWLVTEKELLENYENLHQDLQIQQSEFARFRSEGEFQRKQVQESQLEEVDRLQKQIAQLEAVLAMKEEQLQLLSFRVEELDKAYNDSKLEVERLLNEEKLNAEEKILDVFQQSIDIPLCSELDALNLLLEDERRKVGELQLAVTAYHEERTELMEKLRQTEGKLSEGDRRIEEELLAKLADAERRYEEVLEEENGQRLLLNEYSESRQHQERVIEELRGELDSVKFDLSCARRKLEEANCAKEEVVGNLKAQLGELEAALLESCEKKEAVIQELRCEVLEKSQEYEKIRQGRRQDEHEAESWREKCREVEEMSEMLKGQLRIKDEEIFEMGQLLEEEQKQLAELRQLLEVRTAEITDLKSALQSVEHEIRNFRDFEKQMKELRQQQRGEVDEAGASTSSDVADWSEHELAELSTKLQSDLDTALYMLHQRDVRCDELTFELMQLLEERDTLQLRLSTAIRINEDLKSQSSEGNSNPVSDPQESKDLVDQSNDRQTKQQLPKEDLRELANKISQLHTVGYRDKTIQDESVQRHRDQMSLLGRISDSDLSLSRDVQSSPTVLLNWIRGKSTPKVMHI